MKKKRLKRLIILGILLILLSAAGVFGFYTYSYLNSFEHYLAGLKDIHVDTIIVNIESKKLELDEIREDELSAYVSTAELLYQEYAALSSELTEKINGLKEPSESSNLQTALNQYIESNNTLASKLDMLLSLYKGLLTLTEDKDIEAAYDQILTLSEEVISLTTRTDQAKIDFFTAWQVYENEVSDSIMTQEE